MRKLPLEGVLFRELPLRNRGAMPSFRPSEVALALASCTDTKVCNTPITLHLGSAGSAVCIMQIVRTITQPKDGVGLQGEASRICSVREN